MSFVSCRRGVNDPYVIQFDASESAGGADHACQRGAARAGDFRLRDNFLRLKLFTIPGLSVAPTSGGKNRQIIIEADPGPAFRPKPVRHRSRQCLADLQRHRAGRFRAHWRPRIQCRPQFQPEPRSNCFNDLPGRDAQWRLGPRPRCRQSQRQLSRCKPRSCMSMAIAPPICPSSSIPMPQLSRSSTRRATCLPGDPGNRAERHAPQPRF